MRSRELQKGPPGRRTGKTRRLNEGKDTRSVKKLEQERKRNTASEIAEVGMEEVGLGVEDEEQLDPVLVERGRTEEVELAGSTENRRKERFGQCGRYAMARRRRGGSRAAGRRRATRRSRATARTAQARDGAGDTQASGTEQEVTHDRCWASKMCETGGEGARGQAQNKERCRMR